MKITTKILTQFQAGDQFDPLEAIRDGRVALSHTDCVGGKVTVEEGFIKGANITFRCSVCGESSELGRVDAIQSFRRVLILKEPVRIGQYDIRCL